MLGSLGVERGGNHVIFHNLPVSCQSFNRHQGLPADMHGTLFHTQTVCHFMCRLNHKSRVPEEFPYKHMLVFKARSTCSRCFSFLGVAF